MEKLKIFLSVLLCAVLLSFSGCGGESSESGDEKLKYYYVADSGDLMGEYVRRYNLYCDENYDDSYKIDAVEFDTLDKLQAKLSTEIMAGGGSDILTTSQGMAFEKLVGNGAAADVDELAAQYDFDIGISECSKTVMDAGIMNGKRFAIPLACSPNVYAATEEILEKYGMTSESFSFEKLYESLKKSGEEYSLFGSDEDNKALFYCFLDGYVDFENKSCNFESEDFSKSLDVMYGLLKGDSTDDDKQYSTWNEDGDTVFCGCAAASGFDVRILYYANILNSGSIPTVVSASDTPSISVDYAFAVNNNCKNKEKLLPFIKYCLGERGQSRMYKTEGLAPVNTAALNTMLDEKYENLNVDFNNDGITDKNENAVYEKAREMAGSDFKNAMNNAEVCTLYSLNYAAENYYNKQVVCDAADKYLSGDISKDKFISQLTSTTEIYLDE